MNKFFLIPLYLLISYSIAAQSTSMRESIEAWTYKPLEEIISQVCGTMQSYQEQKINANARAQSLMAKNPEGKMIFGYCNDDYFRATYPADTANLLVAASREFQQARLMISRWSFVLARANALNSRTGTKELYLKYGDQILKTLENAVKRKELINRELLVNSIFFHEWVDRPYNFGAIYCDNIVNKPLREVEDNREISIRKQETIPQVTAGGRIDSTALLFSYPANGQANFYPLEFLRMYGLIKFRNYVGNELQETAAAGNLWIKWTSAKGKILFTRAVLRSTEVTYQIPAYFLENEEFYRMELVAANVNTIDQFLNFYGKRDLSDLIEKGVYHLEKQPLQLDKIFFKAYFRVSKYNSALSKIAGQSFYLNPGEQEVYLMPVQESFGAEEIASTDGRSGMFRMSVDEEPSLDKTVYKMYDRSTGLYLNHPSQQYVDYLNAYRDSLNIDSLIAIEFLPMKERVNHYRKLRFLDEKDKKSSAYNFAPWLPEKPTFRTAYSIQANTRRVMPTHFDNPISFQPTGDTIRVEVDYAKQVKQIHGEYDRIIQNRLAEYANLLQQLNELANRPVVNRADYRKIVTEINPDYLTDPSLLSLQQLPRKPGKFVNITYSFPMGSVMTTVGNIPLR